MPKKVWQCVVEWRVSDVGVWMNNTWQTAKSCSASRESARIWLIPSAKNLLSCREASRGARTVVGVCEYIKDVSICATRFRS